MSRKKVSDNILKPQVLDALVMKVKNFFPDVCHYCNDKYSFKFNDEPFLECGSCGQEVHKKCYFDLLASMNLLDDKGNVSTLLLDIPGVICMKLFQNQILDGFSNLASSLIDKPFLVLK